ncbi:unnamed protein product [Peniophora sp. CBMAI 1063]|nr:unnamed protein product [Peniophora sp. CBMAI 1063]
MAALSFLRPTQNIFSNRGLFLRYIVLPIAVITLLWTFTSFAVPDWPQDYLHWGPPGELEEWDGHGPPPPPFIDDGPPPPPPKQQHGANPSQQFVIHDFPPPRPKSWAHAAERVKAAFVHGYEGYEKFAHPHDELRPLTDSYADSFNGWGVTRDDSLDTMLLMNLTDMFDRAMLGVKELTFDMKEHKKAPFFETTIRHLGGLLSAYALSGNPIALEKAEDLGTRLSPVFNTTSGLALFDVNTVTGATGPRYQGALAEIASCQLEYMYLGKASGKVEHYRHADNTWEALKRANLSQTGGMMPTYFNLNTGQPVDSRLSVGAMADSGHEYLIKQYIQTARTDKTILEMYLRMTNHVLTRLIHLSPERKIMYPALTMGIPPHDQATRVFEHLACFMPGLFALGVNQLPLDNLASIGIDFLSLADDLNDQGKEELRLLANYKLSDLHKWAAEGMSEGCATLYHDQPSGLSPDEVAMATDSGRWFDALEEWRLAGSHGPAPGTAPVTPIRPTAEKIRPDIKTREYSLRRTNYELRPEAVEALFLTWRMTHDERWRLHAWNIFVALERETKTKSGFASASMVDRSPAQLKDSMPSFVLAETFKYLYLIFMDDLVPLDQWVFNTEAHPLPVFSWTESEKIRFGIPP